MDFAISIFISSWKPLSGVDALSSLQISLRFLAWLNFVLGLFCFGLLGSGSIFAFCSLFFVIFYFSIFCSEKRKKKEKVVREGWKE